MLRKQSSAKSPLCFLADCAAAAGTFLVFWGLMVAQWLPYSGSLFLCKAIGEGVFEGGNPLHLVSATVMVLGYGFC